MTADSFSVQPWARTPGDAGALKDVLARVNVERGHFRDINEASVQQELAAEGALTLSESEEESDDEEEVDTAQEAASEKPKTREELFKAKYELLASVHAAQQEISISLDFVSLLISKENAKAGVATISPLLKSQLPMGSLGVDIWQKMPNDKAREAQDGLLATSVRLDGLKKSADGLLSAASQLQNNVRRETEYWKEVLTISEDGWNVCRIPGQQNRLAVRFGFSESSSEFSRRGLAAINTSADGKISLERGVGRKPKALHATLRKGARIVGTSKLPNSPDPESTTLGTRIRHARDSLYDEELYHEMVRESRMLGALGVSMMGSAIEISNKSDLVDDTTISLDLVSLDDEANSLRYDPASVEDRAAQATVLAVRLLLTKAHRDRLKKRSEVPSPMSDKRTDERPLLPLLRPLIAFFTHRDRLQSVNSYIDNITSILRKANIDVASSLTTMQLPERSEPWDIDGLIGVLLRPWKSEGALIIKDARDQDIELQITVQTELGTTKSHTTLFALAVASAGLKMNVDSPTSFISTTSATIASALARASLPMAEGDWTYEENEALLIKDEGVGTEVKTIELVLDSGTGALTLRTTERVYEWKVDGPASSTSFWDAIREAVAAQDS